MLQQSQVGGELGAALRDTGQRVQHPAVDLAGVGLPGHRDRPGELERRGHPGVQLPHLAVVPAEQFEEAGLGSRGALAPPKRQRAHRVPEGLGIQREIVEPQRGTLAHSGQLSRLEVGVRHRGKLPVTQREVAKALEHGHQAAEQQLQDVPHDQQVGVVGDVGAGCPQMDVRSRRRGLVTEVMDVRHHVVPQTALMLSGPLQIRVVQVGAHLRQRALRDVETEAALLFR